MVTQKVCGKVKEQTSLMCVLRSSPRRRKEQHSSLPANQCVAVCCPLSHHSCWTPPLGGLLNFYSAHKILMTFAKWIKGPYSFRAVCWILKTYVSRAVNLLEARGGGEESITKSEECCHLCPNESYKKMFSWELYKSEIKSWIIKEKKREQKITQQPIWEPFELLKLQSKSDIIFPCASEAVLLQWLLKAASLS